MPSSCRTTFSIKMSKIYRYSRRPLSIRGKRLAVETCLVCFSRQSILLLWGFSPPTWIPVCRMASFHHNIGRACFCNAISVQLQPRSFLLAHELPLRPSGRKEIHFSSDPRWEAKLPQFRAEPSSEIGGNQQLALAPSSRWATRKESRVNTVEETG